MKHLDLVSYYMGIFGIERGPEFYSPINGFSVLMPTNREAEKRFTAFIKALGYKLTSRYLWENHDFTNSPNHIHKKRVRQIGGGFHLNFLADHVLSVSFEPIEGA